MERFCEVIGKFTQSSRHYSRSRIDRHYKEFESYAHIVKYVGPISDKDLASEKPVDPVLQIPKFQIGKVGVEKKLEKSLRGTAGVSRVEVNATGRVMRELNRIKENLVKIFI